MAEQTEKMKVLNVGGNNKSIPLPPYFKDFEHLLLDIDPRGKPDVVADARELDKLEAKQFDAIYCSHNLEHYYRHDVMKVLKGFHHVLKDQGFAEIRVPDIPAVMTTLVDDEKDIDDVLYESAAGPITIRDVVYGYAKEIEESGQDFYAHKTGFSKASLKKAVLECGFSYVVQIPGAPWEILAYAFKDYNTHFLHELLRLKLKNE
ncbi:MAG: methyltransferase domain-containing protein [Proteobacteria bacterium]|nr:methyltransferase domain-containing protein [Pseudomonadota bacterium]